MKMGFFLKRNYNGRKSEKTIKRKLKEKL